MLSGGDLGEPEGPPDEQGESAETETVSIPADPLPLVADPRLMPRLAVYDPGLVATIP